MATSEHWKDKVTGERKEATEWHRIAANNRLGEIASKYLKKGGKVYIEGSLRTMKWKDQRGAEKEITEIEILAEDGADIPLASQVSNFLDNEDFKGFIWAIVDIDLSRYLGKAEKVNVTLPSRLIHLIDDKVGKDKPYKSRSALLAAGAEKILQAYH